ncbi:MAG TPA: DUF4349 domain-containing protein [Peptococcaceae bacterium]|nr:DUF4349 domain-containing protein [Peptococcaceae bacterium]
MKEDKIKALWEEDGDLMRVKDFFTYIYQSSDLKERIKDKTIEKIAVLGDSSSLNNSGPSPETLIVAGDTGLNEADSELKKGRDKKRFLQFSAVKSKILAKRKTLQALATAAVLVIAVYFGSSLMNDQSPSLLVGSADKAKSEEMGAGISAAPAAQSPAGAPNFSVSLDNDGQALDSAYNTREFNKLQGEKAVAPDTIQQKIIYVLEATIKTDDVASTVKAVENKVASVNGYIAESRQYNERDHTTAYLNLRVPVNKFEEFKGGLEQFGTVSDQHLYTDDVSQQYYDVETRLRSWEAQEERYLEILKKANTVEEILKIEDSLANVRREMESLKGQLKYLDNRVEYSEIRLHIQPKQSNIAVNDPWQPVSIKNTFIAAKNALIKSVSFLWNFINYLIVFTGYAIPIVIILGILWLIYRSVRKAKKKQQDR